MIDIELLRNDPEKFRGFLKQRNYDPGLIDAFLTVDEKWRSATASVEKMRVEQKRLGAERKIEEAKKTKEQIGHSEEVLKKLEVERTIIIRKIPNVILEGVPEGKDDSGNVTLREEGTKPRFNFKPKDYLTISENLGIIDTSRAAKVSGSRFGYILGGLARLEFALVQLVFNTLIDSKVIQKIVKSLQLKVKSTVFVPVVPPVMIKREMMAGMGYVERGGEEIYLLDKDNLYLVGTSEQSIGPMHSDETLEEKTLPRRYVGFSTCFRREAGSYGKDTKGILRVHQFDKLEMFSITTPETSRDEHRLILGIEEYLMQALKLPYRVLNICSGDLGDPAAAKFDIEAWMPGQRDGAGEYRETHSTSNTTDFQSRRLRIRYRTSDGKSHLTHMLNGTAFAIGRILIAIIENNQTVKGTIRVPKALQKYAGFKEII